MASDNKGLIALLCVLGAVIVGLVVGIVIIMNTGNGGGNDEEDNNDNTDETVMMTSAPTEMDVISMYGEELLTQRLRSRLKQQCNILTRKAKRLWIMMHILA